jgi:AcrR family transcriptional regulator
MGRTRAYDEGAVLSGAMHAFRRKGYLGVSIRDLEQATGLKLGSIYNSYGDKEGLFRAAFAHYLDAVLRRRIADHAPMAAGLGGLRALFLSLLREPGGGSFGCLITNVAVELGGDGTCPAGVDEGLRVLGDTFADRLKAARRDGGLGRDLDVRIAALKLLALYQGILVLVRAGHDKQALRRLINHEFKSLEGSRT